MSSLNDAHTRLVDPDDIHLPLSFRWLSDGVMVSGVADSTSDLQVGDELLRTGGL